MNFVLSSYLARVCTWVQRACYLHYHLHVAYAYHDVLFVGLYGLFGSLLRYPLRYTCIISHFSVRPIQSIVVCINHGYASRHFDTIKLLNLGNYSSFGDLHDNCI